MICVMSCSNLDLKRKQLVRRDCIHSSCSEYAVQVRVRANDHMMHACRIHLEYLWLVASISADSKSGTTCHDRQLAADQSWSFSCIFVTT